MPFSIILNGYPKDSVPVAHIQGPALQGMFLHLIGQVDPAVAARLHNDNHYRPYTLSPLGIGEPIPDPSQEGKNTPLHPPQGGKIPTPDPSQEGKNTPLHPPQGGKIPTPTPPRRGRTPPYTPLKGGRYPPPTPPGRGFQGFRLPRERILKTGTSCYLRITLLEDHLFPTFSRYFLSCPEPTFRLGETQFAVTSVLATPESENEWSNYISYAELIDRAIMQAGYPHPCPLPRGEKRSQEGKNSPLRPPQGGNPCLRSQGQRRIKLHFVTPTSFRKGDVDLPLPLPRLVFRSYQKRFEEFYQVEFLPAFEELVDLHTGISSMKGIRTDTLKTKKVTLTGFVGEVSFEISKKAPPELVFQMNLLADFAFFCGTGKKTTVGMGQTIRQ